MKKAEQVEINKKVLLAMHEGLVELEYDEQHGLARWLPLNHCKAHYAYVGSNYVVLKSFNTIVATINTYTGYCYDFSRFVYGYTAKTSQQICKFAKHFEADRLTYRN